MHLKHYLAVLTQTHKKNCYIKGVIWLGVKFFFCLPMKSRRKIDSIKFPVYACQDG